MFQNDSLPILEPHYMLRRRRFNCQCSLTPIARCPAQNVVLVLVVDATPQAELFRLTHIRRHVRFAAVVARHHCRAIRGRRGGFRGHAALWRLRSTINAKKPVQKPKQISQMVLMIRQQQYQPTPQLQRFQMCRFRWELCTLSGDL